MQPATESTPFLTRCARIPRQFLILMIRGYQLGIRPLLAGHCKFYPTCSEYGIEALERHGVFKGSWLTARRVCRCHPLRRGGVDLVP